MDVLPRITRQLFELFRAMSPIQRATFVAVPALVLAGVGWLVLFDQPQDFQAVLFGKAFASDELVAAEKALNQAGLLNYRREDHRLLVPAAELNRYNAALIEFDGVPPDLGSQILKQFESLGPFSTDRHRQEMKDALLLQELRQMIKSVPDVEDARVAVASSGRRVGFGQKPRVTANVTVKPRAGRELSSRLVHSLRQAVASMVPDLLPADVTVFDVARGQAYAGEQTDVVEGGLIQRVRDFTGQYERQIQKALSFIPNATVTVNVDLDNLKSSVIRRERVRVTNDDITIANRPASIQQVGHEDEPAFQHSAAFRGQEGPTDVTREVTERELLAALPRSVQVSVGIPRDYYQDVAARRRSKGEANNRRLDLDSIEEEVLTKVERTVARLIPAGSPPDAISVTTVDPLPAETLETTLSATDQLQVLAWRHGGSVVLGLFVVWALWMLSRLSIPARSPEPSRLQQFGNSQETHEPIAASAPTQAIREPMSPLILRDGIQDFGRENPAATAAVISQWLTEAR
jgi:flagellar M-ring protein FliF